MRIRFSQRVLYWGVVLFFAAAGLLAAPAVFARDKEICWGGAGFNPKIKNSCRFVAYIYKPEMQVRIRLDTYETFEDVAALRLIPPQGRECVSKQCKRMSRHIYSPWECSFPAADFIKLSGLGILIAENQYGQNLLTDEIDFDEIRTLFRVESKKEGDEDPQGE
ncbi:MAG TPA: hypothetical protein PLT76_03395 [Candidatus Omnitrophota bacterium]|nr:hypothetical protein [Candidatus Omnitrophota bacterium]HPB68879.1 hypothetical protein [Candidatus Omnitrophota bacterium]HQO57746.1 hypothetical protein [Candidatus Omnitrophota bacterium]HQP12661.1 hypothetical protein [Candidatus Omnitrophota bacterium]